MASPTLDVPRPRRLAVAAIAAVSLASIGIAVWLWMQEGAPRWPHLLTPSGLLLLLAAHLATPRRRGLYVVLLALAWGTIAAAWVDLARAGTP